MSQPPDVQRDVLLGPMTSYRIGGLAKYYTKPGTREGLLAELAWANAEGIPTFVLGGGTNVLVADRGYDGLIIHLRGFLDQASDPLPGGECEVGAGAMLTPWVRRVAGKGFTGVEALIGIPGTIGGALRMNAGAFSQEISQPLVSVDVIGEDLNIEIISAGDIGFSYRKAPGLQDKVILSARFQLESGDPVKLIGHLREIIAMRRNRQPLEWPSCGSVFKRPPGDFAGRLIEAAGLKGLSYGGAEIPQKHANFIVNRGGARAEDVLAIIKTAKQRVQENFGVTLEREVILIGFTEDELEGM